MGFMSHGSVKKKKLSWSEPQWAVISHPLGWLKKNKKEKETSLGESVEELEPLCTPGGNVKMM